MEILTAFISSIHRIINFQSNSIYSLKYESNVGTLMYHITSCHSFLWEILATNLFLVEQTAKMPNKWYQC